MADTSISVRAALPLTDQVTLHAELTTGTSVLTTFLHQGISGPAGPQGVQGVQGPPGPDGGGYYEHVQTLPEAVWTVVHNLLRYPAISVIDSAGDEVEGEIRHLSTSVAELRFSGAFSGMAVCN